MIQVIDRALDILEFLGSDSNNAKSLDEISEVIKIKKTTCSNILKSLLQRGYLEQPNGKRNYKLGFKAYKLVGSSRFHDRMAALAHNALQALYDEIEETVVLAAIEENKRIVISNIEATSGITARINHSYTIYRAATGRVILACYPQKKLDATIDRIGLPDIADWPEIKTREQLISALNSIKEAGLAESHIEGGIIGIAVPLYKKDIVIASIGVCLPAFRCSPARKARIIAALSSAARAIEKELANGVM